MKNTKKLTMGSMLLAILGAIMVINRLFAFAFDELIFLVAAEIIIIYGAMYTVKDALILSFGAIVITLLLGGIFSYIYLPLGIIAGLTYAYGISKDFDRSRLLLMEILILVLGEVLITMIVLPIFGYSLFEEVAIVTNSMKDVFAQAGILGLVEDLLNNIAVVAFVISLVLTGALEGALIHLLSIYLLKRLKIKNIKIMVLYSLKISPVLTYIAMAMVFALFALSYVKTNEFMQYLCITIGILGGTVLVFIGYIFFIVYGSIVLGKNISFYLILISFLFFPYSIVLLLIFGFLYGSGPLRKYIERKSQGK